MPLDNDVTARHHYLAKMPRTDHKSSNAASSAVTDTDRQQYLPININGTLYTDAFTLKTLSTATSPPTTPGDQGHGFSNAVVGCSFTLHQELFQGHWAYKVLPQGVWQMMPYHKSIDGGQAFPCFATPNLLTCISEWVAVQHQRRGGRTRSAEWQRHTPQRHHSGDQGS